MKKIIILGIVSIFLLTSFNSIINAGEENTSNEIITSYSFESPVFSKIDINNTLYDSISIDDAPCGGNPGEPLLPGRGSYILLPSNSKVNNIVVNPGEMICLGSGYLVEPAGEPVPLSEVDSAPLPVPDDSIYSSTDVFPGNLYTKVGTYNCRGYTILVLKLNPVQYIPATGELFYYPDLSVSVETVEDNDASGLFRGLEKDEQSIMAKIDNPSMASSYNLNTQQQTISGQSNPIGYDLVIITSEELKEGYEPLALAHNATGVHTLIKTVEDITSDPDYWVTGKWGDANPNNPFIETPITTDLSRFNDTQAKIRNFIRNAYSTLWIDYVLLGADNDVIPARYLYSGAIHSLYIPSDLYYSCLDGTFNYDNDNWWGEPTDGDNGGDIDLMAEVYVGRACVDNLREVDIFVSKTLAYMSTNPNDDYLKKVLMIGEFIAPWVPAGGWMMEELIDQCNENGYTTVGIPSLKYNFYKFYEPNPHKEPHQPPGFPLPLAPLIILAINTNVHIINHLGHGNNYRVMLLNEPVYMNGDQIQGECHDIEKLTNNKCFFIYSQACLAGAFDNKFYDGTDLPYDCIGEYLTIKTEHGAFAGILNSRLGYCYDDGSTDGPSQRYHREFWDAVFNESKSIISKANEDSKMDNIYRIEDERMRYGYYQLILFGDPTIDLINHPGNTKPNKPETPSGPTDGEAGVEYEYTTCTTDPDGHSVQYGWDWNDIYPIEWTEFYPSGTPVTVSHSWIISGSREIRVKARDIFGAESEWSDTLTITLPINEQSSPSSQPSSQSSSQSGSTSTQSTTNYIPTSR